MGDSGGRWAPVLAAAHAALHWPLLPASCCVAGRASAHWQGWRRRDAAPRPAGWPNSVFDPMPTTTRALQDWRQERLPAREPGDSRLPGRSVQADRQVRSRQHQLQASSSRLLAMRLCAAAPPPPGLRVRLHGKCSTAAAPPPPPEDIPLSPQSRVTSSCPNPQGGRACCLQQHPGGSCNRRPQHDD